MKQRTTRAGPGLAAALIVALTAGSGWGLSMRHSAAEARVDGARPGAGYSLPEAAGLSLANTGREKADVDLWTAEPAAGELKDGFEPIPKAGWLALDSGSLALAAGQTAGMPARVNVPKHADELGRFQAQLFTESKAADGSRLKLASSVLVVLADESDEDVEKARKKAEKRPGVEVVLAGREKTFEGVSLGRRVKLDGALKVANVGMEKAIVVVTVDAPAAEDARKGFEPSPNPRFVRARKRVETIEPGKVEELRLDFQAPDEARYRGRAWEFAVTVEPLESERQEKQTLKLFVRTAPKN